METKQCKQCGEIKPIEQFRQYYGGRKGTYTVCKMCEKINSRAKYIERKGETVTSAESEELNKIYRLYDAQRACGLQPPRRESGRNTKLVDNLDSLIASYTARANQYTESVNELDTAQTPPELLEWLTKELTEDPEYYLDEVYEVLKNKYRPALRIDAATLLPVYDDTHKTVLDKILARFNEFEDSYYNREDHN